MEMVRKYSRYRFRIIDLSGDFRLSSPEVYKQWYGKDHTYAGGFANAVFGLPELFSDRIREAKLVANPGCYPTSAILGTAPLLSGNRIDLSMVIVDAKSGVTGAGIRANPVTHFSNVNDNFKAYGMKSHRHTIEIQETMETLAGSPVMVQFTPHLLPVDRGILSTIYVRPAGGVTEESLREVYRAFYAKAPFIRVRDDMPTLKSVRGTNYCDICVSYDERTGLIVIVSVIDNLVKGAAGQAVQNMNLVAGIDEKAGLDLIPLNP